MTLEERIEALEKKVKELSKSVPEEPENKRWRAEKGEKYWLVSHYGLITYNVEDDYRVDSGCYNRGNYFKTKEEAELYEKKRAVTQKVKDIAIRLGEPTEEDWRDSGIAKYYLGHDCLADKVARLATSYIFRVQGTIYCLDDNFLNTCLAEIGEEDLKLIFT